MSIQSDIEMLSIQIMESYAARNNLSPREVNDKFHKHQIFEKIILQHEYLHQISFEEVMEFVEKSLQDAANELLLYYGTVAEFERHFTRKKRYAVCSL